MDKSFCEYVAGIHRDPLAKPERLKIREFMALQAHVAECETCSALIDEVLEKYKDVPPTEDESKYN